jgi:hypothetical protein
MKNIRNLVTLAGLTALFFALGTAGARAQSLSSTQFAGDFTLPFEVQWGRTILPVGEYSLYYGRTQASSSMMVEVRGKEDGSPHVFILPVGTERPSTAKDALVLVREGNAGIVRTLELSAIGTSVEFAPPPNTTLMARNGQHKKYTQLAEGPMLIQRIPVTFTRQ